MKIDLSLEADKRTFISWAVCSLTAEDGVFNRCFSASTATPNEKITDAEIKLTINGVELDAKLALERLYEEFQHECKKASLRYAQRVLEDAVELKLKDLWHEAARGARMNATAAAQQQQHISNPVAPTKGDLRVWHIPQIPGKAFHVYVQSVQEAKKILTTLARYDSFQFEHNIKGDYANVNGLEVFDPAIDPDWSAGWFEWCSDEGDDIHEV